MTFVNDLNQPVDLQPNTVGKAERQKLDEIARGDFQTAEAIAELTYEAERRWEKIIGDQPRPDWDELAEEKRQLRIDDVLWIMSHASASIVQQHDAWRARRVGAGSTSPNIALAFDDLPWAQQRKGWIARHIAHAIVG